MEQFWSVTLQLLAGFEETLKVFALTLVFSLPLGLLVCFGSMRIPPLCVFGSSMAAEGRNHARERLFCEIAKNM